MLFVAHEGKVHHRLANLAKIKVGLLRMMCHDVVDLFLG